MTEKNENPMSLDEAATDGAKVELVVDELNQFTAARVLKYRLSFTSKTVLVLPANAVPLHVGEQGEDLMVWVLVPTEGAAGPINMTFGVVPTGLEELRSDAGIFYYIGTVQRKDGTVWHIFRLFD